MASIILGLLLLGLIRPQTVRGNAEGPVTYDAAKTHCENTPSKGRLSLYMDREEQDAVTKEMGVKGYTSVWLPVKRKYIGWQLLNGTNADKQFAEQTWPLKDTCAILHLPNRVRQADNCNIKRGYICQSNDSCTAAQNFCFKDSGVTYHYQCEQMNWYAAREKCEKDGKVLALFTNHHSLNMYNDMRIKWLQQLKGECDKVWMGIRKEEWEYEDGTKKENFAPGQYWDAGEPKDTGNCVILHKKPGGIFVWKATDCLSKQHVVCQGVVDVQTTVQAGVGEQNKDPDGKKENVFPFWIIIIVVVVIGLAVIGFVVWRRRKRRMRRGSESSPTPGQELVEMEKKLLPGDEHDHPANGAPATYETAAERRERILQQREGGEDLCGLEEEEDEEGEVEQKLDDDLRKFAWYHGPLRRSEAQELIKNPGDYLVYRADAENVFVLVIGKANNSVVHHPIEVVKSSHQNKEEANDLCGLEEEGQDEDMLKCNGVTFAEISDIEKDENFKKSLELVSPVLKEAPSGDSRP